MSAVFGVGHFERVAREVSRLASELLCAATYVLDPHDVIVASSDVDAVGRRVNWDAEEGQLQVPLSVSGGAGRVVVGQSHGAEPVSPRLAQVVVELVIGQATAVDRLPRGHELKHTFIHDLLRGANGDDDTMLRQARILGLDLTPPRAVILVDAAPYVLGHGALTNGGGEGDGRDLRRAQLVIGSIVGFFRLPNDTICAYIGEGEIAVLKASDTKNLANWAEGEPSTGNPSWANLAALKRAAQGLLERLRADTGSAVSVGIGRYHRGVGGLARSYQDARTALSLGRRLRGENHVHTLDALGAAAFVGVPDEATKVGLARHLLSPLDAEAELLGTLEAFFQNDCHPISTAKHLGIHRNTLTYRLEKITLLTGIDPRCFEHAVQMRLAMLLRDVHGRQAQNNAL